MKKLSQVDCDVLFPGYNLDKVVDGKVTQIYISLQSFHCGILNANFSKTHQRKFYDFIDNCYVVVFCEKVVFRVGRTERNKGIEYFSDRQSSTFIDSNCLLSYRFIDHLIVLHKEYSTRKISTLLKDVGIDIAPATVANSIKRKGVKSMEEIKKPRNDCRLLSKSNEELWVKFKNAEIERIIFLFKEFANEVLSLMMKTHSLINIIDDVFMPQRKHEDAVKPHIYLINSICARMKNIASIKNTPTSIDDYDLLEELGKTFYGLNDDGTFFHANALRKYIDSFDTEYKDKSITTDKMTPLFSDLFNRICYVSEHLQEKYTVESKVTKRLLILDSSKIDVGSTGNYEGAEYATDKNGRRKGYKVSVLRSVYTGGDVVKDVTFTPMSTHDVKAALPIFDKKKNFRDGDILLMDRGYIDLTTIVKIKSYGADVIIPGKKNMDIYVNAVSIAQKNKNWVKHKTQSVCLVTDLTDWKTSNILDTTFTACVVKSRKYRNKTVDTIDQEELDSTVTIIGKSFYRVFLYTGDDLTASEIIGFYGTRWHIETKFKDLKQYWSLEKLFSRKLKFNMFYVYTNLLAHSIFELYKSSERGKQYRNMSLKTVVEKISKSTKSTRCDVMVIKDEQYGLMKQEIFCDIIREMTHSNYKIIRELIVKGSKS